MGKVRIAILGGVMVLLFIMCKLNVHQRHFNLFILGLFILMAFVIAVFWLSGKREFLKHVECIEEKRELGS